MVNFLRRNVSFTYFLCAVCSFVGASVINVATTVPPKLQEVLNSANGSEILKALNNTRRILNGFEATDTRPYMVYLKLPQNSPKFKEYSKWLCGGVIVHDEYILTSAACIEDVKHFYVVSGTYKYSPEDDRYNNECIRNGAKKAVWKCIPRNYVFDGHENDNIRWMNNDIAVVKVEEEFDFNRRIRGCDFVPKPICYNNQTARVEEPGNDCSIAGWGSTDKYNDWVNSRRDGGGQDLLETNVKIVSKNRCKKRWGKRYHNIIDNYMICTKDVIPDMSEICSEKYVDCTDIMYSAEESGEEGGRRVLDPESLVLHSGHHNESGRKQAGTSTGGFCENDHGGPLVHGVGDSAMVIGIISACLVKERTNKCYGPFLYTSVYKNRVLINCAIYKDAAGDCTKLFRSNGKSLIETELTWVGHPDGPSKTETKAMRRHEEEANKSTNVLSLNESIQDTTLASDNPLQHGGVIVRTFANITLHKGNKTST